MLYRDLETQLLGTSEQKGWLESIKNFSDFYSAVTDWKTHPAKYISLIQDYDSYLSFKKAWMQIYAETTIVSPGLIKSILDMNVKIQEYNASLYTDAVVHEKKKPEDIPYLYNEEELKILSELNVYCSEYQKGTYDFLASRDFKNKIFKHTIATLDSENVLKLVNEGLISEASLKELPFIIAPTDIFCGLTKTKDEAVQKKEAGTVRYHENLEKCYEKYGLVLPETTSLSCKLKGVTFDNRQEALRNVYLAKDVTLKAEKYFFDGEPAVRILANADGTTYDIGVLDKAIAREIDDNYANAKLDVAFDKFDGYQKDGKTLYYAELNVNVYPEPIKEEDMERDENEIEQEA